MSRVDFTPRSDKRSILSWCELGIAGHEPVARGRESCEVIGAAFMSCADGLMSGRIALRSREGERFANVGKVDLRG